MSSWFGSRNSSTSSIPAASSVNKQKHKQIEWLREQVPNVIEMTRDELYRVDLTINGIVLTLTIKLPPSFPLTDNSPIVSVYPPMRHPWINEQMVLDGCPAINNFSIHSNLGKAIQQIIREFTEHPPEPIPLPLGPHSPDMVGQTSVFYIPTPQTSSIPHSPFTYSSMPHTVTSAEPPPLPSLTAPTLSSYIPPPLPSRLEDIGQMSTEELERYLSEEEGPVLVEQYVSKMSVIQQVHNDRDKLFAKNEERAGLNLRSEPDMQESWTQLQEKFIEMQTLKTEYEKLLEEQKQLTEKYQMKNIVANLKTLMQDAETESEVIAEDFLDKKLSLAEFIKKYKKQRVLQHERTSKYEKLTVVSRRGDIHYP